MQQPAISVIVSLYNYEQYIGECLGSLLGQSFQNFEVIVVDDCSTDSSFAVAESFLPQFAGRLKLFRTEKNSGGGGEPRNKGLALSRGEYVFFMDADDVLVQAALEIMYTFAKQSGADTVYCEKYFMSTGTGQEFIRNVHLADERIQQPPFVDSPTFETNDLAQRVNKFIKENYWMTPWLKLVSRNFLIEHDIKFSSLVGSNDVGWSTKLYFSSEKFLRIPNPCYVRRMHDESVSLRRRTTADVVHKWMDRSIRSLKDMDNFMAGIKFFRDNPIYRYAVIDNFIELDFACIFEACKNESPFAVYSIFREKFGEYLGENDVLVAGLCALVNALQKDLVKGRSMK